MMKYPGFATRFKQAVADAGVVDTQKGLAKLLGVSEVMIWSYKNGKKLPRMTMAIKMADIFNVSIVWLLQGDAQGSTRAVIEPKAQEHVAENDDDNVTKEILALLERLQPHQRAHFLAIIKREFT